MTPNPATARAEALARWETEIADGLDIDQLRAQRDAARGALAALVEAIDANGVWDQLAGDVYRANLTAAYEAARAILKPPSAGSEVQ